MESKDGALPREFNTLDAALFYARQGCAVFPLFGVSTDCGEPACGCRAGRECPRPGKHPANNHGLSEAITDSFEITGAWRSARQRSRMVEGRPVEPNVAIATGMRSGSLAVLDIDPKPPKSREERGVDWGWGYRSLYDLEQEVGVPLPATVVVVSGSGGRHLYYRAPGLKSCNALRESLDLKADGGYVVAPPSLHHSGNRYLFRGSPEFSRIASLPAIWAKVLVRSERRVDVGRRPARMQGAHHAPMARSEAVALLTAMLAHPLTSWAVSEPESVSRDVWRGLACNLAVVALECPELSEEVRRAYHVISEDYSRYRERETDRTFDDAIRSAKDKGPMRFSTMREGGAPEDVCTGGSALIDAARKAVRFK